MAFAASVGAVVALVARLGRTSLRSADTVACVDAGPNDVGAVHGGAAAGAGGDRVLRSHDVALEPGVSCAVGVKTGALESVLLVPRGVGTETIVIALIAACVAKLVGITSGGPALTGFRVDFGAREVGADAVDGTHVLGLQTVEAGEAGAGGRAALAGGAVGHQARLVGAGQRDAHAGVVAGVAVLAGVADGAAAAAGVGVDDSLVEVGALLDGCICTQTVAQLALLVG
eukprot:CAMPEP_0116890034 /NCGR_PEP_ID=MMETSP0467-20121206/574_1 /TAXON_ID=283647 /ORGANISM="Mesodinium pulex, Strain SPMC105" /LENGTH=228 /DNA_ID=CAMNT_0004557393 /DNA_START=605 /DNA_END=1292 /DNA_ORIENTATION=+